MAFDGIVLSALVKELKTEIEGGRIERVSQQDHDRLTLLINENRKKLSLMLSVNKSSPRIYLTEESFENPYTPFGFCMLLRKHIAPSRILLVEQAGKDRIIRFHLEAADSLGYKQEKLLIFEIMGKHSNLVLVDKETNMVIDSLKRVSFDMSRQRQVMSHLLYTPPPLQLKEDILNITPKLIKDITESELPLEKTLLNSLEGFSPSLCQEVVHRVLKEGGISYENLEKVLTEIKDILKNDMYHPSIYFDKDKSIKDFHVVPMTIYDGIYSKKVFQSVNVMLYYYFNEKDAFNILKQKKESIIKSLEQAKGKLLSKQLLLLEELREAEKKDVWKLYGDLIISNLHLMEEGSHKADLVNYLDNSKVTIPLDSKKSLSQNAQGYYKKYHKAKVAIDEKSSQLKETRLDLLYLEGNLDLINRTEDINIIEEIREELRENGYYRKQRVKPMVSKKKANFERYELKSKSLVLVGRNNRENDLLTFKESKPGDYWFHVKDYPGSHVLLRPKNKTLTQEEITEAAEIAAYHSALRNSQKASVDYMPIRYLKKPQGARPGVVIFTRQKNIIVEPKIPKE